MRKKTLRVLSQVLCLILLASLFLQAPLEAAQAIPVNVGGQTFNVTPGQWVSVRQGTHVSHYNVRFVNGRPVALEMSQYTKLVFGDGGATAAAGAAGSTQTSAGSTQTAAGGSTSAPATQAPTGGSNANTGAFDAGSSTNTGAPPVSQTQSGQPAQTNQPTQLELPFDSAPAQTTQSGQPAQTNQPTQLELPFDSGSAAQSGGAAQSGQPAQVAGSETTTTTTTTTETRTRAWDPARHPRDPQTGRFISHEEAINRGLMDPPPGHPAHDSSQSVQAGDSTQAGQSGDAGQAGQTAQSGDATQAGQSGDAGQAAQSGDATQAGQAGDTAQSGGTAGQVDGATGKPGVGEVASSKFKSGYMAGKEMTHQGFQNVKDSLKSGFSAKNLLVTAGITVGVDLATQIMRGEKPSARKALRTIASAEFAGGVVGSVTGAAAGSFFVPFLSAVPVVGGALSALAPAFGSIVGSSMGAYLAGDLKNGRFSIREAFRRIDWVGVTGQAIGSTVGAALGSALGPIGTIAGGMIGGYLGNWAAQRIAGLFGRGQAANLPEMAMPTGGSNPFGGVGPTVTIGGEAPVISSGPAPAASGEDVLVIGAPGSEVISDVDSQITLAYSKYQELYMLYNEMLRQGRQEDALEVAAAMNEAKMAYDQLRESMNK